MLNGYFPKYDCFPVLEKKVDKIFQSSLFEFVRINLKNGLYKRDTEVVKCIEVFLNSYGINENDLSLESADKNNNRYITK